jgi:SNF2 family DNA or RNA helicase
MEQIYKFARKEKLTKEILLKLDTTDLGSLAAYNAYTSEFIKNEFDIYPWFILEPYRLRDHQIATLEWMKKQEAMRPSESYGIVGGIVSLTMGLGKNFNRISAYPCE